MKKKYITDEIYNQNFYLVHDCTNEEFLKFLKRFDDNIADTNDVAACYMFDGEDGIRLRFIFFAKGLENDPIELITTISHEILHHTEDVMFTVGMKLSDETEEAFAYYFEYIQKKILKELFYLIKE